MFRFVLCALALASSAHAQLPGERSSADLLGLRARPAGDVPARLVPLTVWANADDGVNGPIGIQQLADGSVLVANIEGNSAVHRFSADGMTRTVFANNEDGLRRPWGVEELTDGTILVSNTANNRLYQFSADGSTATPFGYGLGLLDYPTDVRQLSDQSILVASYHNDLVWRFSPSGTTASVFASAQDGIDGPTGIEQLTDGSVLIASGNTVKRFSPDGNTVSTFADNGDGINGPQGIKQLSDGTVLVANTGSTSVLQFSADGSTVSTFASSADGLVSPPRMIEQLADGTVLISNSLHDRVYSAPGPLGPPPPGQTLLYEVTPPSRPASSVFGRSVASAGNVTADGVLDLVVGQPAPSGGVAHLFDGTNGALLRTLTPPAASPGFGTAVATAGDLTGDDLREVLVGAPVLPGSALPPSTGHVYVFEGATGALLRTLTSPVATPGGNAFGTAVASIVDLTGDGVREIVVGAPFTDGTEPRVYVYNGATGALVHTLFSANPEAEGQFGAAVAVARDLDGDNRQDIIVGAYNEGYGALPKGAGRVHVFSGATGARLYTIQSPAPEKWGAFGRSVAFAGDTNADGAPDLLVGADGEDPMQAADRAEGRAYVFRGTDGALVRTLYVPDPTGRARFGAAVESGEDVDGNGIDDLFVGAPESTPSGGPSYAGRVFAFSGVTGSLIFELTSPDRATLGGFGASFAPLRDINGDGLTDLAVAGRSEPAGSAVGRVYMFGQPVLPDVTVTTVRPTTPISIPPSGGAVVIKNRLTNEGSLGVTVETWATLTRPNGNTIRVAAPKTVTITPGAVVSYTKTVELAPTAPSGTYVFTRYVGTYPGTVLGSASYTFTKSASLAGAGSWAAALPAESASPGEVDEGTYVETGDVPEALATASETALYAPAPNPSTGRATVRFDVAEASSVRVVVYDALGREVAVLTDASRDAGRYEVPVSGLAPGVYVVRMTATSPAARFEATQRLAVVR